jgi:hypothetical protein
MGQVLSTQWIDASGQAFQPLVNAAYDPMNNIRLINNAFIINELLNDRPLLYANMHHAMVVVEADYFDTPYGPNLQSVGVLDPWPYNPPFHPLTVPETTAIDQPGGQMSFLASVRI